MDITKIIGKNNSTGIWVEMKYFEPYSEMEDFTVTENHTALLKSGKVVGEVMQIPVQKSRIAAEQPTEKVEFRLRDPNNRKEMMEMLKYISVQTAAKLEDAAQNPENSDFSLYDLTATRAEPAARMVTDWRGFTDENGNELPFDYEMLKLILMSEMKILLWLEDEVRKLNSATQPEQEKRSKVVSQVKKRSRT